MTELLWVWGAALAAFVWGTWRTIKNRQKATRIWRAAGYELGLDVVVDRSVSHRALYGVLNGAKVHAVTRRPSGEGSLLGRALSLRNESMSLITHVVVKPAKGPPVPPVKIAAKTLMGTLQRKVGGVESKGFGDPAFDAAVEVSGDDLALCALLSPENRHLLRRLTARGVYVEYGQVSYEAAGVEDDGGQLRSLLLDMSRAAIALQLEPAQHRARVIANFTVEAAPRVREKLLRTMLRVAPEAVETLRLVQLALDDDDPLVRVVAAGQSPDGAAIEQAVARDVKAPTEVRKAALDGAIQRGGPDAVDLLDALLAKRPDGLLWDVLHGIETLNHREAAQRLAQILPRISAPTDAARVATTIGNVGDTRQEPALLDALAREPLPVRRAAATALGLVGTLRCVRELSPLTEGMVDGPLKTAARTAIAAIQAREAGGIDGGGLAVVDGGGELAVAGEAGRLAVAEED